MLLSGFCGILSELALFNLASMLLGGTNKTLLYTMGIMMFSMGIGSLLTETRWFQKLSFDYFAINELSLSFLCMTALPAIYLTASYNPLMTLPAVIGYSFLIGILIGMEIPLILRLNEQLGLSLPKNSARVLMADYFGSLMAFAGFPILMLPLLGLHFSGFAGGLINLILALVAIVFFKQNLRWPRLCFLFCSFQILFSLWLGFTLPSIKADSESRLFRDPVRFEHTTPYQTLVVTVDDNSSKTYHNRDHKLATIQSTETSRGLVELNRILTRHGYNDVRLFINGALQFSTKDEHRYHETLIHPLLQLKPEADQALILGGGDGLAARELLKHKGIKDILLVDLDRDLIELFQKEPLASINKNSLTHPRVRAIGADAFWFLRTQPIKMPLIIIDFPDPASLETARLYSREFFLLLSEALLDDGCYAIQSSSPLFQRKVFLSVRKSMEAAGLKPASMHINMQTFEEWGFHIGCKNLDPAEVQKKLQTFDYENLTTWLNRDALKASLLFGKDTFDGYENIPVNELEHLAILDLQSRLR